MAPNPPPSPRKVLPQPVEESKRSNRTAPAKDSAEANGSKSRRPLPQPVTTSAKSSKKGVKNGGDPARPSVDATPKPTSSATSSIASAASAAAASSTSSTSPAHPPPKPTRKFAPQMVETTRRSRRNTDTSPGVTLADQTDVIPDKYDHLPRDLRPSPVPIPPDNSPAVSTNQVPQVPASKFSSAKLAERRPKRHSFRVPDLPAIPSMSEVNESDESDARSARSSASMASDLTDRILKRKKKRRASAPHSAHDERFTGYLLSLAAKTAEKQLREQAMAAYPNEKIYEPVDHYAIESNSEEGSDVEEGVGRLSTGDGEEDEEDNDGDEGETRVQKAHARRSRRESDAGWDLTEMRQHQKKLDEQRREAWAAGDEGHERRERRGSRMQSGRDPQNAGHPPKEIVGWQKDNEIKSMRNAASPPMAGGSLRFPKCQSPRNTRLDVYQYPGRVKATELGSIGHSGLWVAGEDGLRRLSSQSGLWMGVNHATAQNSLPRPAVLQTGLLTPCGERADPFSSASLPAQPISGISERLSGLLSLPTASSSSPSPLPPSPPSSQENFPVGNKDTKVQQQAPASPGPLPDALDQELNDVFVSQLYNYLSLGYPCLARPFDEELAKITQMPLETLRQDDANVNSKGYLGTPEGTGFDMRGCRDGACQRWLALRAYVKEWGRQQLAIRGSTGMAIWDHGEVGNRGGWGAAARKGSWAF